MYTGPIIDGISELHLLPSMSSSLRCIIQGLMVATYFHPYSFPLNVKIQIQTRMHMTRALNGSPVLDVVATVWFVRIGQSRGSAGQSG